MPCPFRSLFVLAALSCLHCINCAINIATVLPTSWQAVTSSGSPCTNVTASGCYSGFANVNAVLRAKRSQLGAIATIAVHDDSSKLVQFHPQGVALNQVIFRKINASAWILDEFTLFTSTDASATEELRTMPMRPLFSNMVIELDNKYFGTVAREQVVSVGNSSVGFLVFMDPIRSYVWPMLPPAQVAATAVDRLRNFYKVDTVVVVYTRKYDSKWTTLLDFDIDVIVTGYPAKDQNLSVSYYRNNTAVIMRSNLQYGVLFASIDPLLRRTGQPFVKADEVNLGVDLNSSFIDTPTTASAYTTDNQWLQAQCDLAAATDPVIGNTTTTMPDGATKDKKFSICRFRECELGTLVTDGIYALRSTIDIVILNSGALRQGWPSGVTRQSHLYAAIPFVDTICYMQVSGMDIYRAINYSVALGARSETYLSSTGPFLQVRGLRFSYNPQLNYSRLLSLDFWSRNQSAWVPLERAKLYTVASITYLCKNGDGYSFSPPAGSSGWEYTNTEVHSVMQQLIARSSPGYTPRTDGRMVLANGTVPLIMTPSSQQDCVAGQRWNTQQQECANCTSGTFQPLPAQAECFPCPTGSFSSGTSAIACIPCAAGYAQPLTGQSDCVPCPAGYESPSNSTTCSPCPTSQYNNRSTKACIDCPAHTISLTRASTSILQCECAVGYYSPELEQGLGRPCEECLEGLDCSGGGNDKPVVAPGYYITAEALFDVYHCLPDKSCVGGSNYSSLCKPPYHGFLCAECSGDYYRSRKGCSKCSNAGSWLPILLCVLLMTLALVVYVLESVPETGASFGAHSISKVTETTMAILRNLASVLVDFAMSLFSITRTSISASTGVSVLLQVLGVFAFQIDVPLPCVTRKYSTSIALQVALVAFVPGAYFVWACIKWITVPILKGAGVRIPPSIDDFPRRPVVILCLIRWYFFLYMPILNSCLETFRCYRHPNGRLSMVSQPATFCSTVDSKWRPLVAISAVGLGLGVALPTAFCFFILLRDPALRSAVSSEFNQQFYYWRLLVLLKRTILSFGSIVSANPLDQLVVIFVTLLAYSSSTSYLRPWVSRSVQTLDTVASFVATLFVASFLPPAWIANTTWSVIRLLLVFVVVLLGIFYALTVSRKSAFTAAIISKLSPGAKRHEPIIVPVVAEYDGTERVASASSLEMQPLPLLKIPAQQTTITVEDIAVSPHEADVKYQDTVKSPEAERAPVMWAAPVPNFPRQ